MHHRDRTRLNHVKAQHLLVEAPALRKVNNAKCAMADAPHLQQGLLRRSLGDHSHLRSPQSCRINRPRKPMTQFSHAFSIGLTSVPICSISTVTSSPGRRSEEHTSELQSLMRISYAVFCLKKKTSHLAHRLTVYHTQRNT